MELNSNSFLALYYKFMFNGNLPKDFCTLFWNTLFSIILFPIAIPAAFFLWDDETWDGKSFGLKSIYGTMLWAVGIFFAYVSLLFLTKYNIVFWTDWHPILQYLIGFLTACVAFVVAVIVLLSVFGFCYACHWIGKKVYTNQNKKEIDDSNVIKEEPKIVIIWNTIRNKYCTKIEWTK